MKYLGCWTASDLLLFGLITTLDTSTANELPFWAGKHPLNGDFLDPFRLASRFNIQYPIEDVDLTLMYQSN